MVESGALRLVAGRVLAYAETDGGVTVRYATRTGESELEVGKVINCTGPNTNLAEVRDPLVRGLRDAGLIRPDALGLGLDTDEDGRLLDAAGRAERAPEPRGAPAEGPAVGAHRRPRAARRGRAACATALRLTRAQVRPTVP